MRLKLIIFAKRFKFTAAWSIYFICVSRVVLYYFLLLRSDILAMLLLFLPPRRNTCSLARPLDADRPDADEIASLLEREERERFVFRKIACDKGSEQQPAQPRAPV